MNPKAFFRQLDARGINMGIRFGPQSLMSNLRMAMQGGEFAKAHGKYHVYHIAVFRAFFTECRHIGDQKVILDVANNVGLDALALSEALKCAIYVPCFRRLPERQKCMDLARHQLL